jgi:hypothetical protein
MNDSQFHHLSLTGSITIVLLLFAPSILETLINHVRGNLMMTPGHQDEEIYRGRDVVAERKDIQKGPNQN